MTSPLSLKLELSCVVAGSSDLPLETEGSDWIIRRRITRSSTLKGALSASERELMATTRQCHKLSHDKPFEF